jgi:4-aminobutyrate aminotransferase-like enzyme
MNQPVHHPGEESSNATRDQVASLEPRSLRTYTPTQAVLARSAGVFHWSPEGKRFYDYSSGVLVANLGHNLKTWLKRFMDYMGWGALASGARQELESSPHMEEFCPAVSMTAYNAVTPVEMDATRRLLELMQSRPGGARMEQVLWAASGSEAIQKALWAALARDRSRDMILATRYGFHGKKGLAGAVTGTETDRDRDPRVRFISFPMTECADVTMRGRPLDITPYWNEWQTLTSQFGKRLSVLITEPYLGGAGSYHPPLQYLQAMQAFCRENDIVFILDEVQSNFGRTGDMFAYESYGLEPDIVVLGKGLGNGVPVAAAAGRADIFGSLEYGEASDTWSANPLCCAGVLATLDEFASRDVLSHCRRVSGIIEEGLLRLKELPFIRFVRGEEGGMVWGVEFTYHGGRSAADWANAAVLACYTGRDNEGIHLLGPLAKKVIRIAPPLIITEAEARASMKLMFDLLQGLTR